MWDWITIKWMIALGFIITNILIHRQFIKLKNDLIKENVAFVRDVFKRLAERTHGPGSSGNS